jgi:hypothetical protein
VKTHFLGEMKIKSLILATGFMALAYLSFSQTVVITDDPAYTTGRASSVLDIKSTSKGLLIPRLTQSERNAISSPEIGLMIFQTDGTAGFYYYSSTGWAAVGASSGGGIQSYTYALRPASPTIGTTIWCSNCGPYGELQVFNAASVWTNAMGGASLPVLPTITTVTQSLVKSTTASSGGSSISAGGGTITARGVCWNTTGSPTIADSKTSDGTGTTDFGSAMTGLLPSTLYMSVHMQRMLPGHHMGTK